MSQKQGQLGGQWRKDFVKSVYSLCKNTFVSFHLHFHLHFIAKHSSHFLLKERISAAAAKSLQSCLTLCNPLDGNPPGSAVPGILQARIL